MANETVAAILTQIQDLETTLCCSECNHILKEPVVIGRCSHTFCKECIDSYRGKECPVCKFPFDRKDSYPDRQLKDLLALLQQLKSVVEDERIADPVPDSSSDDSTGKQLTHVVLETPLLNGSTPKADNKEATPDLLKFDTPKRQKTPDSDTKENMMVTPKTISTKKRAALSTPCNKMRSPFRFKTFSAQKTMRKKLRSPKSNGYSPGGIEKRNAKGETPLHVAVIKGDYVKVKKLLKDHANPNVKDNAGWTPLHEASNHGFVEVTKLLVEHGAIVNVPGQDNITPLHDAVINDEIDIACYLASKGGDIHAKTSLGNTALDLCHNEEDKLALIKAYDLFSKTDSSVDIQAPRTRKSKVVIVCTSLESAQKDKLQKCAQMIKAEICDDFGPEVTHIVTSCDEKGQCNRTLKILQAILSGRWIVSFKWIEMSLEHKKILPEEAFEVPGTRQHPDTFGPKRARENFMKQCPPLFDGCNFYIHGNINPPMPNKEDLSQLIQLGGGRILAREPRVETINLEQHLIPYHAADGPLSDISNFVLYQDKPPRDVQIRMNHICTVTVQWFLACVSQFKLLDPDLLSRK